MSQNNFIQAVHDILPWWISPSPVRRTLGSKELRPIKPVAYIGPKHMHEYSLLMHRIKIKSPAILLLNEQHFFCVELSLFNQSYSGGITTTKNLPDIGGTTIQDVGCLAAMGLALEPGVHTMSNKYSLLMHCIKIKSPAKFLLNEQYIFVGGNISFLCVLSCSSEEA